MGTGGASWLCSCADAAACHLLPALTLQHITQCLQLSGSREIILQFVFHNHVFKTSHAAQSHGGKY